MVAPISFKAGTVEDHWDIASELGWAKTYDAECVALARDLEYTLVTLDERLKRGTGRIVPIIGPGELHPANEDR